MAYSRFDFNQWLDGKPDDEKYSFTDCSGRCAMGQFMASRGEAWDMGKYNTAVHEIIGYATPLSESKTFGELKAAMRKLEPVE